MLKHLITHLISADNVGNMIEILLNSGQTSKAEQLLKQYFTVWPKKLPKGKSIDQCDLIKVFYSMFVVLIRSVTGPPSDETQTVKLHFNDLVLVQHSSGCGLDERSPWSSFSPM